MSPIHPTYQQTSSLLLNAGSGYEIPSSLVNQPSIRFWEMPIRLLPPTGMFDTMLIRMLQNQRMRIWNGVSRHDHIANMKGLFRRDPIASTGNSDPLSTAIVDLVHAVRLKNLPHKVATVYLLYCFLCWHMSPGLDTYENLPDWLSPRPSQLVQPHALWVSFLAWPKLRDKVVNNQHLYATDEFRDLIALTTNINWKHRDIDILKLEDGRLRITPMFERHVCKLESWSLNAQFAQRYPELRDCCRFTD